MGRKYKNPSIIEVVCELQFSPDSPWDATIPGLIYERVRQTFPKKMQETVLTVHVPAGNTPVVLGMPQLQPEERLRFVQPDERAFVQLGRHLLAINQLAPYPSWERYLPLIEQIFNSYQSVAEPTGIHRIGLRYINRIPIRKRDFQASDYFTLYPQISSELPSTYGGFLTQVLFPYEQERDVLKIEVIAGADEMQQGSVIFLDLDYFLARPGAVSPDEALDWVINAHTNVEHAFESCITEQLRQQMDQEASS